MRIVIIADEVKSARTSLHKMIRESRVQVDTILECADARHLMELLERYPAEVLFTELTLPGMETGEMLREITARRRQIRLVAVTGRTDFAGSVRMIRAGAVDYLLKPVALEQVEQVLVRLEEEQRLEESARRLALRSSERYLTWYLWGEGKDLRETEKEQFIADNETLFFTDTYVVCAVGNDERLGTEQQLIVLRHGAHRVALMEEQDLKPFLMNTGSALCAGVSAPHKGLAALKTAFEEAEEMRAVAFCLGKTQQFGADSLPQVPESLKKADGRLLEESARMARVQLIGTGRWEETRKEWSKLFSAVRGLHISPAAFVQTLRLDLQEIRTLYKEVLTPTQRDAMMRMEDPYGFAGLHELETELLSQVGALCTGMGMDKGNGTADAKMRMAVDYIRKNFASDLNMAMVSNYISMNYSLFSLSFKEYTGCNFVNYLRDLRIGKARQLLQTTDMKILEVSRAVGYDNEKHFMRIFKSVCGVSPSEYRKNADIRSA